MRWKIPFVLFALAALQQCSSPDPSLYTLVPQPGTADAAPAGSVSLARMSVAHYLDRPQIVRHHDEYELRTEDTERWAEPLDEMIPRVLVSELSERLPHMQIVQSSSGMLGETETSLAVAIDRFDVDQGGTVVLDARWSLRSEGKDGPLESAEITEHVASPKTFALVAAMSRCLGQLSDRVAASIAAGR